MTIYLSNRDGHGDEPSLTNEEGHFRFQTKTWDGNVLKIGGNELKVSQNSPLAMSVLVNSGDWRIPNSNGYAYTGWIDAQETVTINTSDTSNPRIDCIVLYVDLDEDTTNTANNPGIAKLVSVAGTPAASPTVPNDAAIKSAIGTSNPYAVLANVTVPAGVTQITNANITDVRVFVTLATGVLASLPAGSVTPAALGDSGWQTLTPLSPFDAPSSGAPLQVRKIGNVVYLRGWVRRQSGFSTDSTEVADIPPAYRPPNLKSAALTVISNPQNLAYDASANSDGKITMRMSVASSAWIGLSGSWTTD